MNKATVEKTCTDWNAVVARHNIGWEDGPEGRAVFLVPRFRRGPLAKWLQPRLKDKFIRVNLDDIGSFVWRQFDGQRRFDEVVSAMRSHFGEKVEPADERLQKFCAILYKDKFVELLAPK